MTHPSRRTQTLIGIALVLAVLACAVEIEEVEPGVPPRTTVVTLTPAY